MKTVSVVVANFNGCRHLDACLRSILDQRHKVHEVLLFDNGSTDQSVEFVRRHFPAVRVISSQNNHGFAGAINRAAQAATGEWLAFLNNDMRAAPDWVHAAMGHEGRYQCIASRVLNWSGEQVDFDGGSLQYLGFADQLGIGESSTRCVVAGPTLFACGGAMFIRRDLFFDAGGFDEDFFAVYEDVDLGWRLWLQGHEVFFEPGSVVYHRGHSTLDTRREEKKRYLMHRNALFTIVKNYEQEAFQKIVPVAFLQTVRRAVRFSGVDKSAFYFWNDGEIQQDPGSLWMWKDAINHLVALDDVIEAWCPLMEKRRLIQARRKRPDAEIVALFQNPFRRIFKDANYEENEAQWVAGLGIAELFPGTVPFALTDAFQKDQKREVERLQRELSHLRSQLQVPHGEVSSKRGKLKGFARQLRKLASR